MTQLRSKLSQIFARNVRAILRREGIRQKDLAERLGVTPGAVSHWMTGEASPTIDSVERVAEALDVPAQVLFIERVAENV